MIYTRTQWKQDDLVTVEKLNNIEYGIEDVTIKVNELDDEKVDRVLGKDLSTNDFTDDYKNKVDNIDDILSRLNALEELLRNS